MLTTQAALNYGFKGPLEHEQLQAVQGRQPLKLKASFLVNSTRHLQGVQLSSHLGQAQQRRAVLGTQTPLRLVSWCCCSVEGAWGLIPTQACTHACM
eukprot:1103762-Pelagomonas_calceolata.AAC.1